MLYAIRIIGFIFLVVLLVLLIKRLIKYNSEYKKMVSFLRLEKDKDTLDKIGYKEFYGEEYGLRKSFSLRNALAQLEMMYNNTNKIEYKNYKNFLEKYGNKSVFIMLGIFVCLIMTFQ